MECLNEENPIWIYSLECKNQPCEIYSIDRYRLESILGSLDNKKTICEKVRFYKN